MFLIYFYRLPLHHQLTLENQIVSPTSGKIMKIEKMENGYSKIVVFLNINDIHIQWIPIDGIIEDVKYVKGSFHPAGLLKHSQYNERNIVKIRSRIGYVYIVQIAGLIARRIVSWIKKGEKVKKGDLLGMIKLSSRVDIYLPPSVKITCKVNDKIYGNQTIIGLV